MKLPFLNLKKPVVLAVLAVATLPLTIYAIEDHLNAYFISSFGFGNTMGPGNSTEGAVLIGTSNQLSGYKPNSLGVGRYNIVYDENSVVIGKWNKDTGGDELFVIGNGVSGTPANAMEVFKNGNINIKGKITCETTSGDIPMFSN